MLQAVRHRSVAQRQPIDIEDLLVWTYRDQRADRVIHRGVGLYAQEAEVDGVEQITVSTCGCASVERIQALGVRVDSFGRDAGALHADAEVVHRAVMQLTAKVQGRPGWQLIIAYASRGDRPDAMVGEMPRPVPRLHGRNGKVEVVWTDKGRRYGYCPVEYAPSATVILQAREEYGAWLSLLRLLALTLQGEPMLTRYYPMAPAAPGQPWA